MGIHGKHRLRRDFAGKRLQQHQERADLHGYYWKASSNWIGHPSNINKLSFAMAEGMNIVPVMYDTVSPYQLEVGVQVDSSISNEHIDGCPIPGTCNFFANTGSSGELIPGKWYLLEFY